MSMTPRPPDQRQMALNAKIARNTQLSSPSKNRGRQHQKRHKSTALMHIIVVEPDDNKTIIGIGRIGADMRSAKDGNCT